MSPQDASRGRIGARMRLSAGFAVAMLDWHVELIDFVAYLPA
jgi:hypothetical protein